MNSHRSLSPFNDKYTRIDGRTPVIVNDCTLREGEQSALVNIRPTQKVNIAKRLTEASISRIQVGYPGLSTTDFDVITELKTNGIDATLEGVILGYLPNWQEQMKAAIDSGVDVASIVYVTSKPRYEKIFQVTQQEIKERSRLLIQEAKRGGLEVSFAPADTTRTEIDFVLELVQLAEASGADRIVVADTLGAATPGAVRWLVEQVRAAGRLPIEYHGHNDFGLALANAISAVEAGATMIDTTLNGWGDRTGNPSTEEFVAIMDLLFNNSVGIDLLGITQLSKEVAEELGVPIHPTKPMSGSLAFAHKLETHVKAVLKYSPAFESFDPALVGGTRRVAIGQYSGPEAVAARMATLGIEMNEQNLLAFVERMRESARATNKILGDDDLRQLARELGL